MLSQVSPLMFVRGSGIISLLCWIILTAIWRGPFPPSWEKCDLQLWQVKVSQPTTLDLQETLGKLAPGPLADWDPIICTEEDIWPMDVIQARQAAWQQHILQELRDLRRELSNRPQQDTAEVLLLIQDAIHAHQEQYQENTQADLRLLQDRLNQLIDEMFASRPVEPPVSALTAIPEPELVTKLYPLDDLTVADVRPLIEPLLSADVGWLASTSETSEAARAAVLVRDRPAVISMVDQLLAELTAPPLKIELQITQDTTTSPATATPQTRFTTTHGQPIRWMGEPTEAAPCVEPPWVSVENETEFLVPRPVTPPRLQLSITPRIVRERR